MFGSVEQFMKVQKGGFFQRVVCLLVCMEPLPQVFVDFAETAPKPVWVDQYGPRLQCPFADALCYKHPTPAVAVNLVWRPRR